MSDFITLECPSCGGPLRIAGDIDHFACAYCGNEHVVRRSGSVVSLKPVERLPQEDASELAIRRLEGEIHNLESEIADVEPEVARLSAIRPPAFWLIMAWILASCLLLAVVVDFLNSLSEQAYSANAFSGIGGIVIAAAILGLGVLSLGLVLFVSFRFFRRRSQESRRYNESQHPLDEAFGFLMRKRVELIEREIELEEHRSVVRQR